MTSGKSVSIVTGAGFFASVGKAFRLFVHAAGMKLVTASGKIDIQAQSDDVEIIANKVLRLISQTDWVDIRAKKGVRLHGANCMIEVGEKVQFFTSSPTLFHGNLETLCPQGPGLADLKIFAQPEVQKLLNEDAWVEFRLMNGIEPIAGERYVLTDPEGKFHNGTLDDNGRARVTQLKPGKCKVEFPNLGYSMGVNA